MKRKYLITIAVLLTLAILGIVGFISITKMKEAEAKTIVKQQLLINGGNKDTILLEETYDESQNGTYFANEYGHLGEGIYPARMVTTFKDESMKIDDFHVDVVNGETQRLFRFNLIEIKCQKNLSNCWRNGITMIYTKP